MDCRHAAELTPWYLNGTLEDAERAELEQHLAGCAACRTELGETETARILFGGHPTAEMLVEYVFDPATTPKDVIEAHLAGCETCADELAMARESRSQTARQTAPGPPANVVPLRQPGTPSPLWRAAAVAAALVGLVGLGGGLLGWRSLDRQRTVAAERERAAEERIAELEAELRGLERARLNVAIHDLWPEGDTLRSAGDGPARLPVTEGPPATLILNSQLDPGQVVERLELRDAAGRVLEDLSGVERNSAGSVKLSLHLERLGPGGFQILLFAGEGSEPLESYTFELR